MAETDFHAELTSTVLSAGDGTEATIVGTEALRTARIIVDST